MTKAKALPKVDKKTKSRELTIFEADLLNQYFGPAKMNRTEAFRLSKYKPSKNPSSKADEIFNKSHIQIEVAKRLKDIGDIANVDAAWLLKRLVEELEADVADLFSDRGSLKGVHDWPLIWRQGLIAGFEVKQDHIYEKGKRIPDGVTVKVKLADRTQRLRMVGDHVDIKAFVEDKEVGDPLGQATELLKAIADVLPD